MRKHLVISLLFAVLPALAQTNGPAVDSAAVPVLQAIAEFYAKVPAFKVDMEADTHIETQDMKQQFTTRAMFAVQKPDKLALTVHNSMMGTMLLACDGAAITTFLPALNKYTVRPAPASLERMSQELGAASPACLPVISALIERDPYAALLAEVTRIRYAGKEKRGEILCHRLVFTHKTFDCEAWIRTGPLPLLEAVKPSLAKLGALGKLPDGMKADAILSLSNWTFPSNLPDALFRIDLPADAQKADSLIPGLNEPEAEVEEPEPGEALLLKPAPLFKLTLLGGGTFDLAEQKAVKTVVLCFWTTWAPPCQQALPVLEKIAAARKDIIIVPVNPQETPADIRAFLKKEGLTLDVALDRSSDVAEQYRVAGLPHIVIIDKAGIVREVILGYGKDLETDLQTRLDALK